MSAPGAHALRANRSAAALLLAVLVVSAPARPVRAAVPPYAPHEVLVRLDADGRPKPAASDLFARLGLTDPRPVLPAGGRARISRGALGGWTAYRLPDGADPAAIADSLRARGLVAQTNRHHRFLAAPNDPRWNEQWGARKIGLADVWELVRAQATDSVVIGIVDSGVEYTHPDLAPVMWRNDAEARGLPGVDDDGNGYVDDVRGWDFTDAPELAGKGDYLDRDADPRDESGHGTLVAGLAAGATGNGIGAAGIAVVGRIMALRAGAELADGGGFLQEDDIAAAIVYAAENGARVVNMSFGDVVSSPLMEDLVRWATARGVVLVAAAGNENTAELLFPAAMDEVISVGASTETDARASFSSYGENLDLVAPGAGVVGTWIAGGYINGNGTSFAAPHVAGACALVMSIVPGLSPDQVRALVRTGVADLGAPGWDPVFGFGRLDLAALIRAATDPIATIVAPARPDGAHAEAIWSAYASGAPPVAWAMSYGLGATPRVWTGIAVGAISGPADSVSGRFSTAALAEGQYAVRLSITDALGRSREDRTLLTVDHTPPVFVEPPAARVRWDESEPGVYLEWETDDLATAEIRIWRGTSASGEPAWRLRAEAEARHQLELLPDDLRFAGPLVARIVARNRAGLETESGPVTIDAQPYAIRRSGAARVGSLPPGIVMPAVVDFDRNGRREIALKPAAGSPFDAVPYDSVTFYEYSPAGRFVRRFTVGPKMRPMAAADIDGNGLLDLVGIDHTGTAFRVLVTEQPTATASPSERRWSQDLLLGPMIADADGDGRIDLSALDERDRRHIRVYESPGAGRLAELAEIADLVSPATGDRGQFGITRAIGDFDGDGRPEVAAGTTGGAIAVWEATGDNAFGDPRAFPGDGDATRVSGGRDLTGDGRADFAVLRHIDASQFEPDREIFRLEIWSEPAGGTLGPVLTHGFAEPRTSGTGFAVGNAGPNGEPVVAVAIPPRLYVIAPTVPAMDGMVYYAETGTPAQPLIADLDGDGAEDIAIPMRDSVAVVRLSNVPSRPPAPTNVAALSRDSVSVEVAWDAHPGLTYAVWTGTDADHVSVAARATEPPVVIDGLAAGTPVAVAVQAIDRARADSLGAMSAPAYATPHAGPRVASAEFVAAGQILVAFDAPLHPRLTGTRSFALAVGGIVRAPTSVIVDRDGRRTLVCFSDGIPAATGAILRIDVRDSTGAIRRVDVPVTAGAETSRPAIAWALATGMTTIRAGLTTPLAADGTAGATARLANGPAVQSLARIDERTVEIRLAASLFAGDAYYLALTGLRAADGATFDAGAIVRGGFVSPTEPPRIVAALAASPTEIWIVTTHPLDVGAMVPGDLVLTPRVRVDSLAEGDAPTVLIAKLDPATPIGPWEERYQIALAAKLANGETRVLAAVLFPLADRPSTGLLRDVAVVDGTTIRLLFGVPIATSGQPADAIRIEPGIRLDAMNPFSVVADTTVVVRISPETPLGPWGITYFVHVDSLRAADGEPLTEFAPFTVEPRTDLARITVFPQPFLPAERPSLVFGGLPPDAVVTIYALDGARVRRLLHDGAGGVAWDGTNEAGRNVATGIYLWVVEAPGGRRTGKIALVR